MAISPNFTSDQTLFAGTNAGIYKSTDGGASWSAVNNGLPATFIYSLTISPDFASDHTVFAGTPSGIFKSTDGGASWSGVNNGLANASVVSIVISPDFAADKTVFAAAFFDSNPALGSRVYKSTDGGANWNMVTNDLSCDIQSLAISPNYASDQTVFAGAIRTPHETCPKTGIFITSNGGGSWNNDDLGLPADPDVNLLAVSPGFASDHTVFAGTDSGVYMRTANNLGFSIWNAENTGLPASTYIYSLALSSNYAADQTVFAGTDSGAYSNTLDTIPPTVTNVQPTGGINTTSTTLSADYSDSGSGINTSSVTVKLDGNTLILVCNATATHVNCPVSGLAQGMHTISVSVADNAGNTSQINRSFSVDMVAPTVTNVQPSGAISSSSATISADYADGGGGSGINTAAVAVMLDGSALSGCTITTTHVSCPVNGLAQGSHIIAGAVSDNAGNSAPISGSFTVNYFTTSTLHINDSAGGGDCSLVGTWNAATKTCTLTANITVTANGVDGIHIDSDGVTLDGNGYALTQTGNVNPSGMGVYLENRTGAAVRNLNVSKFSQGISVRSLGGNAVIGNTLISNTLGIVITQTGSNIISGNNASANGDTGIYLYSAWSNTISGNTANSNGFGGIRAFFECNSNTISGNTTNANANVGIGLDSGGSTSNSNTISGNTASFNGEKGIYLSGGGSNTVSGNNASSNNSTGSGNGILIALGSGSNTVSSNRVGSNSIGIHLLGGGNNTVTGNLIGGSMVGANSTGILLDNATSGNRIYHNNFLDNATMASVSTDSNGVFNLAAPVGGNYWSSWTSPDSNKDGFVDSPYVFTGGQDNLPLAEPDAGDKPSLSLDAPSPFWASYVDYTNRQLSVTWIVRNTGTNEARAASITGGANSNGVTLASTLPATVGSGDILPGASGSLTLMYNVPAGVVSWTASLTASAQDGMGATYTYP